MRETPSATAATQQPSCFYRAFESIAEAKSSSGHAALVFNQISLTYAELNHAADQLAWQLYQRFEKQILANLDSKHPGEEILIGIALPRSPEMIIAMLAVMKAGLAYVPLDTTVEDDLLQYWLADSQTKLIICDDSFSAQRLLTLQQSSEQSFALPEQLIIEDFSTTEALHADAISTLRQLPVTPNTLAYVMYTSGSTSRPKGVAVLHRGLMPCVVAHQKILAGISATDKVAQIGSSTFDASLAEIILALGSGASLVIVPNPIRDDIARFTQYYQQHGITITIITPKKLQSLDAKAFPALRGIFIVGEKFDRLLSDLWLTADLSRYVINGYGLTETTICTTLSRCALDAPLTIGSAIDSLRIYLRPLTPDEQSDGQPVKLSHIKKDIFISGNTPNIHGEVFISGPGLAREYWKKPELTSERFFESQGELFYRSGDIAYYQPDGTLVITGRLGQEVKLRGQRIDVEMVEHTIQTHPAVAAACVLAQQDLQKEMRLVAYIALKPGYDPRIFLEIYSLLQKKLPRFAVPAISHFIKKKVEDFEQVEKPGDKKTYDRKKIAQWPWPRLQLKPITPAQSILEQTLKKIWHKLLDINSDDDFSVDDDFFALGGDSLKYTALKQELEKLYPHINWAQLSFSPGNFTLKYLAAYIQKQQSKVIIPLLEEGHYPPIYCVHSLTGNPDQDYQNFVESMKEASYPLFGIKLPPGDVVPETIEELATFYVSAILERHRSDLGDPVFLVGWSTGGLIVLAMGQQLQERGIETAVVVLDAAAPAWFDTCPASQHLEMLALIEGPLAKTLAPLLETRETQLQGGTQNLRLQKNTQTLTEQASDWFTYLKQKISRINTPEALRALALSRLEAIRKLYLAELHYRPDIERLVQFFLIESAAFVASFQHNTLHWSPSVLIENQTLEGDHFSMLFFPRVAQTAHLVVQALQRRSFQVPRQVASVANSASSASSVFHKPLRFTHIPASPIRNFQVRNIPELPKTAGNFSQDLLALFETEPRVVFAGAPGSGKSQLARYHAKQQAAYYANNVQWLDAETPETLTFSYRRFADNLGIRTDSHDLATLLPLIAKQLSQIPRCLIIYDNAQADPLTQDDTEKTRLPTTCVTQHHVLLTSNLSVWPNYKVIPTGSFSTEESVAFILRVLNQEYGAQETEATARELALELGNHPLAIGQAVHTICNEMSIKDYLEGYLSSQSTRRTLLDSQVFSSDIYTRTAFTTWINLREKVNDEAARILNMAAFLGADRIPKCFFAANLSRLWGELSRRSLIQITEDRQAFNIHRLCQRVIQIDLADRAQAAKTVSEAARVAQEQFVYDRQDPKTREYCDALYGHMLILLEHMERLNVTCPALTMQVCEYALFERRASRFVVKQLTPYFQTSLNEEQHVKLCAHLSFANLLCGQDRAAFLQISDLITRCDTTRLTRTGLGHFAFSVCTLGHLLSTAQTLNEYALAAYQTSLKLYSQILPDNALEIILLKNNIAKIYFALFQQSGAIDLLEQASATWANAYETLHARYGDLHAETLVNKRNLAEVAFAKKATAEGKRLYEEVIADQEKVYGTKQHSEVAASYRMYATQLQHLGEYATAVKNYLISYEIRKIVYGTDNHADFTLTYQGLYDSYTKIGNVEQAEVFLRKLSGITRSGPTSAAPSHAELASLTETLLEKTGKPFIQLKASL